METFDSYDYFKTIIADCGINSIKRCSGIINLEEILSNPSGITPPVLVVEDNDSGTLSLSEGNFDQGYYNIFILKPVKMNNAEDAHKVRKECKDLLIKLHLRMMQDAPLWEDNGFGYDSSRIDYAKIGPLASNFYGYSAGFQVNIDFNSDAD